MSHPTPLPYSFTLGVRSDVHGLRPSREVVLRSAEAATAAGFEVLHAGRFALTVRGSAECVKAAFGIDMPSTATAHWAQTLTADARPLAAFIDSLAIAPPPILLAR
jgi:hypothetical protein